MQHLIDGFRKFQAEAFAQRSDLFKHLATTQTLARCLCPAPTAAWFPSC